MYRQKISKKTSPLVNSTPISNAVPTSSYGSLSSIVQRAKQDVNSISGDGRQQLESAIGTKATGEVLTGKRWVPEFKGVSSQLWGNAAIQMKGKEEKKVSEEKLENKTGLPGNLKAGIENLSGIAMDDVKVHYNSTKPRELGALAYTQGTDIHVAPGQEQHLPHEAWHVVQQKEGRVRATTRSPLGLCNDDATLEREADTWGAIALTSGSFPSPVKFQPGGERKTTLGSEDAISSGDLFSSQQLIKESQNQGAVCANDNRPSKVNEVAGKPSSQTRGLIIQQKVGYPPPQEQQNKKSFLNRHTFYHATQRRFLPSLAGGIDPNRSLSTQLGKGFYTSPSQQALQINQYGGYALAVELSTDAHGELVEVEELVRLNPNTPPAQWDVGNDFLYTPDTGSSVGGQNIPNQVKFTASGIRKLDEPGIQVFIENRNGMLVRRGSLQQARNGVPQGW